MTTRTETTQKFPLPTPDGGEVVAYADFDLSKGFYDAELREWWGDEAELVGSLYHEDGTKLTEAELEAVKMGLELPDTLSLHRYLEREVLDMGLDFFSKEANFCD